MKKYSILSILLSLMFFLSCVEDKSAYLPQEKEDVQVDQIKVDGDDETQEPEPGVLIPGIQLVKMKVTEPGGAEVERRFKYFMPVSITSAKPISLIFEFHGSWTFEEGTPVPDPVGSIGMSDPLIQYAIKENCIIVFPAGSVAASGGSVAWADTEKHLLFFDRMVEYFKQSSPAIDPNRIYSTGQSSGAIFSFALAYYRSTVVASIAPRAGQMRIEGHTDLPGRAVPIRVFAGTNDNTVIHSAVLDNMTDWAEMIGGYFAADMVSEDDLFQIENYKKVTVRRWNGGKADMEIYSLKDEGHGVNLYYCMPYLWDFFKVHTLDADASNCFVTAQEKEIVAQVGEKIAIPVNYTDGAIAALVGAPADWLPVLDGKTLKLTAPLDYFGNISRKGEFSIKVTKGNATASLMFTYELIAPKAYFEVGDIYYNGSFEPVGVICWVNSSNIREAKIINLEEIPGPYGNINFGNFGNFFTPDRNDGAGNTAKYIRYRDDNNLNLTSDNSGVIWAGEYTYKGIGGWYLPAIDEWIAIDKNIALINKIMPSVGGRAITPASQAAGGYLSSTVLDQSPNKVFKYFNFYNHTEMEQATTKGNSSYFQARTIKKVVK